MNHPLQIVRDHYLDCFRESIADARSRFTEFTTELLLELPTLKYPEYCYRLYRVDIIGKRVEESGVVEVNVTEREVQWRGLFPSTVTVDTPLVWNGVEFRVANSKLPVNELAEWTTNWLDVSDDRYSKTAEFQHVIHSNTPPKPIDSGYHISVDFGSAPVVAFDELLQIIVRNATHVSVGSFSYVGA